jgi:hypothetical protein
VQALPSSQDWPGSGVAVHDEVPLQVRWWHASEAQVMGVPMQAPPALQTSA